MTVSFIGHPEQAEIEHQLIEKMKKSGVADIGCNPSLANVIFNTWKWPAIKMWCYCNQEIAAFLSIVRVGKVWVSLPHFDHGGLWVNSFHQSFLADWKNVTSELELNNLILFKAAKELSLFHNISTKIHCIKTELTSNDFEIIQQQAIANTKINLACRSHLPLLHHHDSTKVVPTLNLMSNWHDQLGFFDGNVRRKMNKSVKNDIAIQTGGMELLEDFYRIYRSNIHRLGSFGLPLFFFQNLLSAYRYGEVKIFLAFRQNHVAGGAILIIFQNTAENGWFATDEALNRHYVSYGLHAAMIKYAIASGCNTYSFGRSTKNSSGHIYKQQWGGQDVPLLYNTTINKSFSIARMDFARKLLRKFPMAFLKRFDGKVSRIIY